MVSIIIPTFNLEKKIEYCLESILNQSYKNYEIIIVDDGSTDNTCEVCKATRARDTRIKIIEQKHQGVSSARNVGIAAAQGEYIMFVDGDDIISPCCVEHLLSCLDGDTAAVIGNNARIRTYNYSFEEEEYAEHSVSCEDSLKLLIEGRLPIAVWAILFRRECIGKIRFPEKIRYSEDKYFLYQFLMANQSNNIKRISEKVYGYYVRESSATRVKWDRCTDAVKVADKILSETEKNKAELVEKAKVAALAARLQVLKSIVLEENNQRNKALYKKYRREVLAAGFPKEAGVRTKVMYVALRLGRWGFTGLAKLYYRLYSEDRRFKVNEAITGIPK